MSKLEKKPSGHPAFFASYDEYRDYLEKFLALGNHPESVACQEIHHIPITPHGLEIPDLDDQGRVVHGSHVRVVSLNNQPSLTKQADADRCCIHKIMSTYQKTGHLPVNSAQPLQGDIPMVEDYMEAMNLVASVNSQFEMLPIQIREQFGHDPQRLLAFAADEKNAPRLIEMGLAVAPEVPPAVAPVVAPTAAPKPQEGATTPAPEGQ